MGDAEITGDGAQSLPCRTVRYLGPVLSWNAGRLGVSRVTADSRPTSRPQHALGVQEGHERRRDDVYLA